MSRIRRGAACDEIGVSDDKESVWVEQGHGPGCTYEVGDGPVGKRERNLPSGDLEERS